jgi:hypothetical protein
MACEVPRQFNQMGVLQSVRKGTTLETRGRGPCDRSTRVGWGIRYRKVAYLPSGWRVTLKALREFRRLQLFQLEGRGGCNVQRTQALSSACYFDPHRPYQTFITFQPVTGNLAPIQRVSSKTRPASVSTARRCASPITCAYFCKVIRASL